MNRYICMHVIPASLLSQQPGYFNKHITTHHHINTSTLINAHQRSSTLSTLINAHQRSSTHQPSTHQPSTHQPINAHQRSSTLINAHQRSLNAHQQHQQSPTHPRRTKILTFLFALRPDGRCILLRRKSYRTTNYHNTRVGNAALDNEG